MLPRISYQQTIEPQYLDYLTHLEQAGFKGMIDKSYGARVVQSTDNSIYQFIPQAVLYPKSTKDIQLVLKIANQKKFAHVVFSARGGGTGTNAQSLTHGIIIDLSRYMNQILEINTEENWVKVEAGVIKDQLNDALKPLGYFFSPDLSTSNRATIGGMINTDASGAGSLKYGKTSEHVLGLESVLYDGTLLNTQPIMAAELDKLVHASNSKLICDIYQNISEVTAKNSALIHSTFPKLNRFLTGYDLKHVWNDKLDTFDLSRLISGSEGTLAVITQAKLNITPLPAAKLMVIISYDTFDAALRHAPDLVKAQATLVETIDSTVLNLAKDDIIWHSITSLIEEDENKPILGLNMLEFTGSQEEVDKLEQNLVTQLKQQNISGLLNYKITDDSTSMQRIYSMRKKAVGLLGATKGKRKPIAFAEDTVVPPEKLADYIQEFRALLDSKNLQYGMFGHVDAGVLHVRPALDMCDPADEQLLKSISDEVAKLTEKYGGLMWGEHGKGVRGEYAPQVFGKELYHILREIKTYFDPDNKLNPGKLVAPINHELIYNIDSIKRGSFDRQIPSVTKETFSDAMDCNGNGLCFNYSPYAAMCPSYKVSGDRIQSPKGRASLMREWLRLLENQQINPNELLASKPLGFLQKVRNSYLDNSEYDFSHEVMQSLKSCLACKACSGQCPVKVDVAKFRSQFYHMYYQRYLRPAKDYLVANLEDMLPLMNKVPALTNKLTENKVSQWVMKNALGYVDAPLLSAPTLQQRLDNHPCLGFELSDLCKLSVQEKQNSVLIVQDPFNSFYDAQLILTLINFIESLGFKPILLPFKPNGKPAHIKGFLDKFATQAKTSADFLNQIYQLGMPMIGVDPAMVLVYRDEYKDILKKDRGDFNVKLINEWLLEILAQIPKATHCKAEFTWFSHCTESSTKPETASNWQHIFKHFGATLNVLNLGCCGMAGTYGHEIENQTNSKALYKLSWENAIDSLPREQILVSGYSCRSQVKRMSHFRPRHPIEALLDLVKQSKVQQTNEKLND